MQATPWNARTIVLTAALTLLHLMVGVDSPRADVQVLVGGATRSILFTSRDTLSGGGDVRENFDKVYWHPDAGGIDGRFFINHEIETPGGGQSRLRYEGGTITEAVDWVVGTHNNCAGNWTSWGTMMSCEEFPPDTLLDVGFIVEIDAEQPDTWVRHLAMGRFSHEGIIEDPLTGDIYMTDDSYDGVFFRFVPLVPGDLENGSLYAYREDTPEWLLITDLLHAEEQAVALGATTYLRPEDLIYNPLDDAIYIMVTGRIETPDQFGYILRFDPRSMEMTRWLECDGDRLANPDNVEVDSLGNLLVCEDQYSEIKDLFGPNELLLVRPDGSMLFVARGLDLHGEVTGIEMSADDTRFWFNWMNGVDGSELIEINAPPGWNSPIGNGVAEEGPGSGGGPGAPASAALRLEAAPNPFDVHTTLTGAARSDGRGEARLDIYDVSGKHRRTLLGDAPAIGDLRVVWDGCDDHGVPLGQGVYFAKLHRGDHTVTIKVLLAR